MSLERVIFAFAGVMVLLSVILTYFVSPWWLVFTAIIGVNLLVTSLTGFCPAAMVFSRFGFKPGSVFK